MSGFEETFDIEAVEALAGQYDYAAETLEEMMNQSSTINTQVLEGVLLGKGGEMLAEAYDPILNNQLRRLAEKFREMEQDLRSNVESLREALEQSKGGYQ